MLGHENIFIGGADGPRLGSGVAHLEPLRHAFGYRRLQELFKGGFRNNNTLPKSDRWYISTTHRIISRTAAQSYHSSRFFNRKHKRSWAWERELSGQYLL
jgi:hypothetical protein